MKVKDLKTNDIIHCSTLEENDQILDLFISLGLLWCNGQKYKDHNYEHSKTYIKEEGGVGYESNEGTFTSIDFFQNRPKIYTIYPASLFLNQQPIYEIY